MNFSHCSQFNSDTYSDSTYGGTKDASTKHHFYNDDLTSFYRTTVSSLQKIHFCSNVINFFGATFQHFKISSKN